MLYKRKGLNIPDSTNCKRKKQLNEHHIIRGECKKLIKLFISVNVLERPVWRYRAMTCSLVIGSKVGDILQILGGRLIP
jgi:hypothetical protein